MKPDDKDGAIPVGDEQEETAIKEINGRWTCTECGYQWSGMMADADVPKVCPVCMPKLCGRCYDAVDKLVPSPCAEKPEQAKGEDGYAVGMYHCPDCGAMLMAGEPHPEVCERCAAKRKPGFDAQPADKPSKMYILLWDGLDIGHAVNTAAHAGAMICSKYGWDKEDPVMAEWYRLSFRKVTCKVTRDELEKAKTYFPQWEFFPVTESAYEGQEVALVFKPRKEWPAFFRSLSLYK